MNIVSTKEISNIRYLLGSSVTAPNVYRQIKAAFPNSDAYKVFAEPIVLEDGRKIAWSSSYQGNAVCYSRLSEEDKSNAQDILSGEIGQLVNAVKSFNDNSMVDFINNCIEIPTLDDVYIVTNNGEQHAVITEWGFVPDTPGAEKGLLIKFLNIKKIPMKFNVVYSDDLTAAPYEDIIVDIAGKLVSVKSDSEGIAIVEKVKEDITVKVWEAGNEQNVESFTCYPDGKYVVKVTPKGDMNIKVVDQNDVPQSNIEFKFEYDGHVINGVSNSEGLIVLEKIKNQTKVEAYQLNDNGVKDKQNTFIFDRKNNLYKIVIKVETIQIPEPTTHNMRFKVVDEKQNVVRNAEVMVKYDGKTEVLLTDENGYAELKDVPLGTVVEAKAKK